MPKPHSSDISMFELVKTLLLGALGWSNNEMAMAKLDAKALLHRVLFAAALVFAAFAVLTAAVFTLAETLIGALADYLHGNLSAGLLVSAALFCLTGIMLAVGYSLVKARPTPKGVVFRKLLGPKNIR